MAKPVDVDALPKLVGYEEIAVLCDVARCTPYQWMHRGVLPEPDAFLSGTPVWNRDTIVEWARETGRLDADST